MRSLTQAMTYVRAQLRIQVKTDASASPPNSQGTRWELTGRFSVKGMSTSSIIGRVRYGGTMLAAVLATVNAMPSAAIRQRLRAKLSNRRSERLALTPGSAAQVSQIPCSPWMGPPQLGQRV